MQQVALSKADDVEGEHERELQPGSTFGVIVATQNRHPRQSSTYGTIPHTADALALSVNGPSGRSPKTLWRSFFSVLHGDRPADRAPRRSQALPQSGCVTTGHQNKRSGNACLTRRL